MVKANLCLATGSKSFLFSIDVLADERTPTKKSIKQMHKQRTCLKPVILVLQTWFCIFIVDITSFDSFGPMYLNKQRQYSRAAVLQSDTFIVVGSPQKKRGCKGPLPSEVNLFIQAPVHTVFREKEHTWLINIIDNNELVRGLLTGVLSPAGNHS